MRHPRQHQNILYRNAKEILAKSTEPPLKIRHQFTIFKEDSIDVRFSHNLCAILIYCREHIEVRHLKLFSIIAISGKIFFG